MKKFSFILMLLLALSINGYTASSDGGTDEQIVTSTGTTIVTFDQYTNEIYYVRYSTNIVYIDFYAIDCSSSSYTDYLVADSGATGKDAIDGIIEARTKRLSVWAETFPVNIRFRGRHWE